MFVGLAIAIFEYINEADQWKCDLNQNTRPHIWNNLLTRSAKRYVRRAIDSVTDDAQREDRKWERETETREEKTPLSNELQHNQIVQQQDNYNQKLDREQFYRQI